MKNQLIKKNFTKVIVKNNIRIYLSDLRDIMTEILNYHKYLPLPALILGKSIAAFSPLKFLYDSDDLMVRITSNGPIKSMIMEIKKDNIRALISNPNIVTEYDEKNYNSIPLILGIGDDGMLEVSRKVQNEYFNSQTKLVHFDIATDLAYFLNKSDQIYSAILLDVELSNENPLLFSKGKSIIFQLLPNHTEKDKIWVEDFISNIKIDEMSIDDIENKIEGKILKIYNLSSKCWCSKEKIIKAIFLLPKNEQEEIMEKPFEVKCEFCSALRIMKKEDFFS